MAGDRKFAVKLIVAFAAVYLIWGSTYLAILFAIETLPPFLMAGVRFLVAGSVLYAWLRLRGAPRPSRLHWRSAAVVGVLLLVCGNGGVVWAEQWVPSGIASLLVATAAFWMVLFEWLRPGGLPPSKSVVIGLAVGMAGIALLVAPDRQGMAGVHVIGGLVVLFASMTWAFGSIYSRTAPLPASPFVATAMEMMIAGVALLGVGMVAGELSGFELAAVSTRSWLSLAYLAVFGSLIAFSAYIWLLGNTTPARVATYAYVNPAVAVLLGWGLADEAFTARTGAALLVIVGAVAMITTARARERSGSPPRERLILAPSTAAEDGEGVRWTAAGRSEA